MINNNRSTKPEFLKVMYTGNLVSVIRVGIRLELDFSCRMQISLHITLMVSNGLFTCTHVHDNNFRQCVAVTKERWDERKEHHT